MFIYEVSAQRIIHMYDIDQHVVPWIGHRYHSPIGHLVPSQLTYSLRKVDKNWKSNYWSLKQTASRHIFSKNRNVCIDFKKYRKRMVFAGCDAFW